MPHQVWAFIRLIWGQWATAVTGSLSAIFVLIALFLNAASAVGIHIPADPIVQSVTWMLAVACGGQAAYRVWAGEHQVRLAAEAKLGEVPCVTLSDAYINGSDWLHLSVEIENPGHPTTFKNWMMHIKTEDNEESLPLPRPLILDAHGDLYNIPIEAGGRLYTEYCRPVWEAISPDIVRSGQFIAISAEDSRKRCIRSNSVTLRNTRAK